MNKSLSLQEFIDLDELQAIQDNFARTANISSVIVYPDGKPMTRFTNPTNFCSLIQSTEKGKQCCFRSFMEMSKKALELKKPQIFNCFVYGGHFVSPIIINDEHIGTLFAGQFIPQSFSNEQLEEIEKVAVEINVDPVQLIEEAKHMRVVDKDLVWDNASLLFRIEKMITRLGMQAFELQKAHDQQEVLVQERTAELMKSNEELQQEIIERKRIEEALEHRVEFEKLIADISTSFINLPPDKVDAGIQNALQSIGEFSGVDRSYVFLIYDKGSKMDNTHEWCAQRIEPQIDNLKRLQARDFPWTMKKLNRSEVIYFSRVADLPPEASALKESLQLQDIKSVIIFPMLYGGTLIGYIGFDSVRQEKTWSKDSITLLKMVSEIFINALERRRSMEVLQSSEKKFYTMFEKNPLGTLIIDQDRRIIEVNEVALALIGRPRKEILGHVCHGILCPQSQIDCPIYDHGQTIDHQNAIILSKDHGEIPIEKTVTKINVNGENMLLEMFSDITERKHSEKIEAAYTDILTIANRTLDLHTIVSEGLDSLMKYIDAQAGAVYLYDQDHKIMIPNVIRGMKKTVAKQEFSPGEGIVGETELKQEMIVLTSIPEDTIYTIKSGSDRIIPTTIVSTPIIFKGMLLGVVITCHTTNVPPEILSFIKRVIDQYAVAVNNADTFIQVQEIASSLKNQRDELEIRSHELIVANKTKSEFLSNMGHELRTPLNSIIGFSHILHDETVGPLNEKQSKYVNNVLVSGNHLLKLINGILDLANVEAGKMELTCEDFNVCAVIEESVMLLSSVALKKNIILNTAVDEELTTIHADMGKFKQILYNLMSNAVKFTPNGGSVTVEGRYNRDMAQIAVIDTGIGISKEDQDKLFNPFVQLDASLSRVYEGTGLGLVLVKRFVEMHGGNIWIKSEPDRGSKFIFTIPIKSSLALGVS